jgi:alcohol dehydrogenase (cytochrome c)
MGNGLLGTAGGLIFTGHRDGRFSAYDKDTMQEVWHFNTGSSIGAPPMTFSVDGQQYVAVLTGGGPGRVRHPALASVNNSPMLFVFAL